MPLGQLRIDCHYFFLYSSILPGVAVLACLWLNDFCANKPILMFCCVCVLKGVFVFAFVNARDTGCMHCCGTLIYIIELTAIRRTHTHTYTGKHIKLTGQFDGSSWCRKLVYKERGTKMCTKKN